MRKRLLLAMFATGACCGLVVFAIHSEARAQDAGKSCNSECLLRKIDMLDKKVDALERTVDVLSIEANKSIKSGQQVVRPAYRSRAFPAAAASPISTQAATAAALFRGM